jgi:ACS family 4-hydroxyphenylacetate permease-like MFS transporter
METDTGAAYVSQEDQALRKAFRYLIPFLFVMFIFSYLDRINVGFAALSMNKDLKLTATMFGLANTFFYLGYALCEVPSNMLLAKYGARKWLARIMITWGLASAATMFAVNANSLYTIRLLVGIAEAGFMPGILLYLTYWFPPTYRARAIAVFLAAQPVTIALGSPISGFILDHSNQLLGLVGWQWMFIFEGLPAVLLGIIAFFYLPEGPAQAKWLSPSDKELIKRSLEREVTLAAPKAKGHLWREVFSSKIMILGVAYFGLVVGLNTLATWTPQIVREVTKAYSFSHTALIVAFPAIATTIAMPLWGMSSDRRMERTWHIVAPMLLAALGWALIALVKMPELRMFGLVSVAVGAFLAMSIFWTLPPNVLSSTARPVGIALINTMGICASAISPMIVGYLKDLTHSWTASLMFVVLMLLMGAVLIFLFSRKHTSAPEKASCQAENWKTDGSLDTKIA